MELFYLIVMQQGDSFIQYLEVSETATSFITPGNHFYHLIPTIGAVNTKVMCSYSCLFYSFDGR